MHAWNFVFVFYLTLRWHCHNTSLSSCQLWIHGTHTGLCVIIHNLTQLFCVCRCQTTWRRLTNAISSGAGDFPFTKKAAYFLCCFLRKVNTQASRGHRFPVGRVDVGGLFVFFSRRAWRNWLGWGWAGSLEPCQAGSAWGRLGVREGGWEWGREGGRVGGLPHPSSTHTVEATVSVTQLSGFILLSAYSASTRTCWHLPAEPAPLFPWQDTSTFFGPPHLFSFPGGEHWLLLQGMEGSLCYRHTDSRGETLHNLSALSVLVDQVAQCFILFVSFLTWSHLCCRLPVFLFHETICSIVLSNHWKAFL